MIVVAIFFFSFLLCFHDRLLLFVFYFKNEFYFTVINPLTPKSAKSKLNFNVQNQQKQTVKHESAA